VTALTAEAHIARGKTKHSNSFDEKIGSLLYGLNIFPLKERKIVFILLYMFWPIQPSTSVFLKVLKNFKIYFVKESAVL
jgi:hypothetical protein